MYFDSNGGETDFVVMRGAKIAKRIQVWYDDAENRTIPERELNGFQIRDRQRQDADCILVTNDLEDTVEVGSSLHSTTVGFDLYRLYDNGNNPDSDKNERINKKGGFVQHRWKIVSPLEPTLGLRYEDVEIHVSNWTTTGLHNPAYGMMPSRDWDEFVPKSFLTYHMDGLAAWLRDTSLSMGISKIWRVPDYHGHCNPQGRPDGLFLDPEHGVDSFVYGFSYENYHT